MKHDLEMLVAHGKPPKAYVRVDSFMEAIEKEANETRSQDRINALNWVMALIASCAVRALEDSSQ